MRRPDVEVPGPVPFPADLPGGLDEPAMAGLTRPIKPRSHDRSHAGISHERLARRRYVPCPRLWRLRFDPRSFRDTRRLANPEVSDGDATLGWPWDSADRVFGPYGVISAKQPSRSESIHLPVQTSAVAPSRRAGRY